MNIKETDNTGYLCEEDLSGLGTKSWEDWRLFAEYFFVPLYCLFRKSNNKKTKTKKTSDYGSCCVSSLRAQYKINHWPQNLANIGKKMRSFSTLRTLLLPSDGKVVISRIHAACVWKCTLIACTLILTALAKMSERKKQTKMGKKLETPRE